MEHRSLLACLLSGILLFAACSKKNEAPASSTENNQPPAASSPAPQPPPESAAVPPAPTPEKAVPPRKETPSPTAAVEKTHEGNAANAAPKPQPPPPPIVIPSGTVLTVQLQQGVSSKTSKTGDRFDATLAKPLIVQGKTLAPAGASASGTVTQAQSAGKFKGAASLNIILDTLVIEGDRYQIKTAAMSQTSKGKGKRSATMIGGGTGAGALIGGIAGGGKGAAIGALVGGGAGTAGAAITGNNNDITLPAEAAVSFQITAPIALKSAPPNTQAQN